MLYLAELFLLREADVPSGKSVLPSGLCSLLPGNAEPVTVFTAGVKAKIFLEKQTAGGHSLLESHSWMLAG